MSIPDSVKRVLPKAGQELYLNIYEDSLDRTQSEATATAVAWKVVKKKFKQVDGKFIASNTDFIPPKLYAFTLEPAHGDKEFILNTEGDEIVLDAVLADSTPRKSDGKWFGLEELKLIAQQINTNGSALPDINHEVFMNTLKQATGLSSQQIVDKVKDQKGIFKKITAAVKDGKLWIKAFLDKRFKRYVEKFKALSIEAVGSADDRGRIKNPQYVGFTFTDTPNLPGAQIAL